VDKPNESVSDGLFTVQLDFGSNAFTGDARWLQISVRCPAGSGDWTTFTDRQELTATPYALFAANADYLDGQHGSYYQNASNINAGTLGTGYYSAYADLTAEGYLDNNAGTDLLTRTQSDGRYALTTHSHWGASWNGSGTGLSLDSSDGIGLSAAGETRGVSGISDSTDGRGVYGRAGLFGAEIGTAYGGYFESREENGTGVYGYADSTSGTNYGVTGRSDSTSGRGVYGYAPSTSGTNYGVIGRSDSTGGYGVEGYASATSGYTYGVYGRSDSTSGYGVFAYNTSSGIGLYAKSWLGNPIEAYSFADRRFYVSNTGEVYADGSFHSGGADLAEMLSAMEGLEPGDVLVVSHDGKLTRSTGAYQSTVVGVYSTNPGFVGGAGDDADLTGKVPLAIAGLVPVKASAENGPIRPGDLLVASSTPGHAMRGGDDPPIGTVIGKALESLDSGTGVIQMLVMLQ
jgi:hypothetical protein